MLTRDFLVAVTLTWLSSAPGVAQPVMQIELRCTIVASHDVGDAPCNDVVQRDPQGIYGTTSRSPAFADAYVEATARAKPGDIGVQAIATVTPRVGFVTNANGRASAQSNDTIQVVSTQLAGTRSTTVISNALDWSIFTRWPGESSTYMSSNYTSFSWTVLVTSFSRFGQIIDTLQMHAYSETRSPLEGSIYGLGRTTVADDVLVESGGSFRLSMVLTSYVGATGALWDASTPFVSPTEARFVAMNSMQVYLEALDDSVTFVSSSGHDYAAPVPEPSGTALMATGLGVLLTLQGLRRRGVGRLRRVT